MPGPLSEPTPIGGTSRRHHAWAAAAGALVVLGTIGSAFGANAVARNSNQVALQALQSSSAEIASTLQLAVQREDDLTISAGGFIASNPNVSNRQFSQWVSSLHTVARYPELRGLGYIAKVTAAACCRRMPPKRSGTPLDRWPPVGRFRFLRPATARSTVSKPRRWRQAGSTISRPVSISAPSSRFTSGC